jgi:hypothetical protein
MVFTECLTDFLAGSNSGDDVPWASFEFSVQKPATAIKYILDGLSAELSLLFARQFLVLLLKTKNVPAVDFVTRMVVAASTAPQEDIEVCFGYKFFDHRVFSSRSLLLEWCFWFLPITFLGIFLGAA